MARQLKPSQHLRPVHEQEKVLMQSSPVNAVLPKRTPMVLKLQAVSVACVLLLSACAVGPDYQRPSVQSPNAWKAEAGWGLSEPSDEVLKGDWWAVFGDDQLSRLQELASKNNLTIAQAFTRFDQAREQTNIALSSFLPQVNLQGGSSRFQTSQDRPLSGYNTPNYQVRQDDYNTSIAVSYEADLSGRVRRRLESARAQQAQASADFENLKLLIGAQVAANYFSLRQIDTDLALLQQQLNSQDQVYKLIKVRYDTGYASSADLDAYRIARNNTQSLMWSLRDQRNRFENALATLVGQDAATFKLAPASELALAQIPAIPLTQPAKLLERRPDIASAERAMAAANAQIGIAKSAYFPTINLAAALGSDARQASMFFAGQPSTLWSLGLTGTQMLFDAGRTEAAVKQAQAGYQQTVANYRQTVLSAFEEVQNNLSGLATLQASRQLADQSEQDALHSYKLIQSKLGIGTASPLEVTLAEQTWIAYKRQQLQTTTQQLLSSVQLIKSLGGGWNTTPSSR
jgi:NodT family efflux transporter outer membrane factor (OMF) lipoprotein